MVGQAADGRVGLQVRGQADLDGDAPVGDELDQVGDVGLLVLDLRLLIMPASKR